MKPLKLGLTVCTDQSVPAPSRAGTSRSPVMNTRASGSAARMACASRGSRAMRTPSALASSETLAGTTRKPFSPGWLIPLAAQ